MPNQEVLEKAMQKAIDGGWQTVGINMIGVTKANWDEPANEQLLPYLIFNHDFAKALWGEDMFKWASIQSGAYYKIRGAYSEGHLPLYMYHLQMMVIADDPIEYLGEHLDD